MPDQTNTKTTDTTADITDLHTGALIIVFITAITATALLLAPAFILY